jgi:histidine triad (HIT) family protein
MSSIFTKIINRQIPAFVIAEDNDNIAFLDINPLSIGHALVVPKKEEDYLFDLDDDKFMSLNLFAKKVARALKVVTGKRIGTMVMGLEVPHAHIHLIPFTQMSELNFANPKLELTNEVFAGTAAEIGKAFDSLN